MEVVEASLSKLDADEVSPGDFFSLAPDSPWLRKRLGRPLQPSTSLSRGQYVSSAQDKMCRWSAPTGNSPLNVRRSTDGRRTGELGK
jgi:hypothetical protein